MTRAKRPHPVLFVPALVAAYPAAFMWTANADEVAVQDGTLVVLLLMAVGLAVHLVVRLASRRRLESSTAAVVASLVNAVLFVLVLVAERLPLRFRYAAGLLGAALLVAIVWLWHVGGHRPGLARALTLATVVAYLPLISRPLLAAPARRELNDRIRAVPTFATPIASSATPAGPPPDIYLFVLDTYGGHEVLRSLYDVDDRPFRDSLRALGFALPVAHANYPVTSMALASMLNAAYLDSLTPLLDGHKPGLWPFYTLIRDDRVTAFLRTRGYTSYFVPSVPWIGTLVHERAEVHLTTPHLGPIEGRWVRSLLLATVWPHTLVGHLLPARVRWSSRSNVMAAFEGPEELLDARGPKFVLVHSMASHFPFSVDSSCRARPQVVDEPESMAERPRAAYADGIRCTHRAVLRLVREILRRSPTPPVILLQGDHGPRGLGALLADDPERITAPQARERFDVFGAYYLPGAPELLPDTVTPVNVMRATLSHYLGAALPLEPDRSLHASMERPYRFVPIPPALLRSTASLEPRAVTLEERPPPRRP